MAVDRLGVLAIQGRIKSSKVHVPLLELGLSAAKIIRTGQKISIVALNSELGITIVGR